MIIELNKKIVQIVDLSISELQLNQNLFDVIDVTASITPFHSQLFEKLDTVSRRKGCLWVVPLLKDDNQLEKIVFFATGLKKTFEGVVQ